MGSRGQDFWLQATQWKYSLSGANSLALHGGTAFEVRCLEERCLLFHQTSSSVRICFGEWSKHPLSLSLLHFWAALKLWLHGIYILIGGTPEIHYTSLWECTYFTSVAGRTLPYLSKFSSSSFFRFGGRPRLLPVFPGTFGVFVCPPHPLKNGKTTMKYLPSKGTEVGRMGEGHGNRNSC